MSIKISKHKCEPIVPVGRMAVRSVELMLVLSLSWCFFMCGARSCAGAAFAQPHKHVPWFAQCLAPEGQALNNQKELP